MADARIWIQDKDHAVGTMGPVLTQVWRGANTFHNWRAESTPIFKHLEAASPKGCCVFIVAEETAALPDKLARAELDLLAKERNRMIVSSVILASGGVGRVTAVRAPSTFLAKEACRYSTTRTMPFARWFLHRKK